MNSRTLRKTIFLSIFTLSISFLISCSDDDSDDPTPNNSSNNTNPTGVTNPNNRMTGEFEGTDTTYINTSGYFSNGFGSLSYASDFSTPPFISVTLPSSATLNTETSIVSTRTVMTYMRDGQSSDLTLLNGTIKYTKFDTTAVIFEAEFQGTFKEINGTDSVVVKNGKFYFEE